MINRKTSLFFAIPALVLNLGVTAFNVQADDQLFQDSGSWWQVVGESSLKVVDPSLEKGRIWLEGQARFNDDFGRWYQGMARAALGYSLTDRATIWAGYTWLPTQYEGKALVSQQDLWPAFRYVLPTDFGTFMSRTMIEANFLQGSDVRFRPRQMLRFMHPFEFEPRLSFITWDEFFIRVNSTPFGGKSGFDQNRAFIGAGWTFNKNVRTELGYMNQYLDDANHNNNTMRHLMMGSVVMNF